MDPLKDGAYDVNRGITSRERTQNRREAQDQSHLANSPAGQELDALKARIAALEKDLAAFRITGNGFSGQGPNGIMFDDSSTAGGDLPAGLSLITVDRFVDGSLIQSQFLGKNL